MADGAVLIRNADWTIGLWYGLTSTCPYVYGFAGTGTRFPGVRLLALPVLHNRPWPLRRSRGDGNGRPLLPSFLRHSMCSSG